MGASVQKDVNALLRRLRTEFGCTIAPTGGGHWRVSREGCRPIVVSASPSRENALRNVKRDARRHLGIEL